MFFSVYFRGECKPVPDPIKSISSSTCKYVPPLQCCLFSNLTLLNKTMLTGFLDIIHNMIYKRFKRFVPSSTIPHSTQEFIYSFNNESAFIQLKKSLERKNDITNTFHVKHKTKQNTFTHINHFPTGSCFISTRSGKCCVAKTAVFSVKTPVVQFVRFIKLCT